MKLPEGFKIEGGLMFKDRYQWYIYVVDGYSSDYDENKVEYNDGSIVVAKKLDGELIFYEDIIHNFDINKLKKFNLREEKLKRILEE